MGYSRKDVEKSKMNAKKFVRYQEGAEKYSLGLTKFQELAKEAKAVYKIDKVDMLDHNTFWFSSGTGGVNTVAKIMFLNLGIRVPGI